jgi:hypothetical protein
MIGIQPAAPLFRRNQPGFMAKKRPCAVVVQERECLKTAKNRITRDLEARGVDVLNPWHSDRGETLRNANTCVVLWGDDGFNLVKEFNLPPNRVVLYGRQLPHKLRDYTFIPITDYKPDELATKIKGSMA